MRSAFHCFGVGHLHELSQYQIAGIFNRVIKAMETA